MGALKETVRRLRGGGLVALLIDRDVGNTGVPIEFCGEVTRMPLGAYELALRAGADILPAWSLREPGYRFRATIGPPLAISRTDDFDADVRAVACQVLDLLEQRIRSAPGQWAVLERVWDQH
jgi:KDO2-lipid IV(A) lauroyltransferase